MGTKKNSLLYWAGLAALLYMASNYLSGVISSKISFGTPRLKKGPITFEGIRVEISQPISNKLPVSFPIDSFQGSILYGEKVLSTLMLTNPIVVDANATSELKINADLNFANVVGNISDLIQSGEYLQGLYLKGFVASSGVIYPFKEKISLV